MFDDNITKIRCDLEKICSQQQTPPLIDQLVTEASFFQFELLMEDQIVRLIKTSASKWCDLDPFLTPLLKECFTVLLPVITKIVNLSLITSTMSENMKEALLLLKKANLDHEIVKHFRAISNLSYNLQISGISSRLSV